MTALDVERGTHSYRAALIYQEAKKSGAGASKKPDRRREARAGVPQSRASKARP